jgi:hypothetical protein
MPFGTERARSISVTATQTRKHGMHWWRCVREMPSEKPRQLCRLLESPSRVIFFYHFRGIHSRFALDDFHGCCGRCDSLN